MVVVVSATAVESQDTLHVIVPVVEAPVAVDIVAVEAVVVDQVSTHHHLKQFYWYYCCCFLTMTFLTSSSAVAKMPRDASCLS